MPGSKTAKTAAFIISKSSGFNLLNPDFYYLRIWAVINLSFLPDIGSHFQVINFMAPVTLQLKDSLILLY